MKTPDIGFIVAMKDEAEMVAAKLRLTAKETDPGALLEFINGDGSIMMITPGQEDHYQCFGKPLSRVGKVAAGVATTLMVELYHPRMLINCGTAGGIAAQGVKIGDVVIADYVTNHDIRIPLPGYAEYGVRKISVNGGKKVSFLKNRYTIGTVSSGESFTTTHEEWEQIRKSGALMKEMEAGGTLLALEILHYKNPVYVVKAATDLGDEKLEVTTSADQFVKNFTLAMDNLLLVISEMVENFSKGRLEADDRKA